MRTEREPVFHVSHDGTCFPRDLMESVCVPYSQFMRYHRIMRDRYVSRLVPDIYTDDKHMVKCNISRLADLFYKWFICRLTGDNRAVLRWYHIYNRKHGGV